MEGMMMGFFALQAALAMIVPQIDETSGPFDYLINNLSTLAMQISTVGFLLTTEFAQGLLKSTASVAMGIGSYFLPSIFGSATALQAQAAASAAATGADTAEAAGSIVSTAADISEAIASLPAAGPIAIIGAAMVALRLL